MLTKLAPSGRVQLNRRRGGRVGEAARRRLRGASRAELRGASSGAECCQEPPRGTRTMPSSRETCRAGPIQAPRERAPRRNGLSPAAIAAGLSLPPGRRCRQRWPPELRPYAGARTFTIRSEQRQWRAAMASGSKGRGTDGDGQRRTQFGRAATIAESASASDGGDFTRATPDNRR